MTGYGIQTPEDQRGRSLVWGKSFTSYSLFRYILPSPSPSLSPCQLSPRSLSTTFLWFLYFLPGLTLTRVLVRVIEFHCYAGAVRHELLSCTLLMESKLYKMIFKLVKSYNESSGDWTQVARLAVLIATSELFCLRTSMRIELYAWTVRNLESS